MSSSKSMLPLAPLRQDCNENNPVIVEVFYPKRGWVRQGWRKRASAAWLRKLRREGGEGVAIELPNSGRLAYFSIAEILKAGPAR